VFTHVIAAKHAQVTQLVTDVEEWLTSLACASDDIALVLAEALNNIVEHAYSGRSNGTIEVRITHFGGNCRIELFDHGVGMPEPPAIDPVSPKTDTMIQDLPEGGFGWFLICQLCEDYRYRRAGGRNELMLTVAV